MVYGLSCVEMDLLMLLIDHLVPPDGKQVRRDWGFQKNTAIIKFSSQKVGFWIEPYKHQKKRKKKEKSKTKEVKGWTGHPLRWLSPTAPSSFEGEWLAT